jgi:hypothetical protein
MDRDQMKERVSETLETLRWPNKGAIPVFGHPQKAHG